MALDDEKVRLFVGGLSSDICEGDLRERFAPLGNVQSISLVPAKTGDPGHRGFAYVDFVPTTDASLRKLFSAYNGCKWRGGLLRIEKAKELFTARLHREWASNVASLAETNLPVRPAESNLQNTAKSGSLNGTNVNSRDLTVEGLKIFFPRLGKLKNVPLKGLGKHKRSFQRVEESPLQLLSICACDKLSCQCSSDLLNSGTCLKEDDISFELTKERERQLELLARLFPTDGPSTSLEHHEPVELDDPDLEGISACKFPGDLVNAKSKLFAGPHIDDGGGIQNYEQTQQRSGTSGEKMNKGLEDVSIPIGLLEVNAGQSEPVHQIVATVTSSSREPDQVIQPELSNVKKRKIHTDRSNAKRTKSTSKKSNHIDEKSPKKGERGGTLQETERNSKLGVKPDGTTEVPTIPKSILLEDLSEDDFEMTLNLGDDSMSTAIGEAQERLVLMDMAPEQVLHSRDLGITTQLEITDVNASRKEVGEGTNYGQGHDEGKDLLEEEGPPEIAETKLPETSLQASEGKSSIMQQSPQPPKQDSISLFQSREVGGAVQSAKTRRKEIENLNAAESTQDDPSNSTPAIQVDGSQKPFQLPVETVHSPGEPLKEVSMSEPKLTRAAWRSLVGETGRVSFSLSQITGSNQPSVSSTAEGNKKVENLLKKVAPSTFKRANSNLPVNIANHRARVTPKASSILVAPTETSGDLCPFMKSENSEKEWLESKAELRSDYRAKHKNAARNLKKLRGKRT